MANVIGKSDVKRRQTGTTTVESGLVAVVAFAGLLAFGSLGTSMANAVSGDAQAHEARPAARPGLSSQAGLLDVILPWRRMAIRAAKEALKVENVRLEKVIEGAAKGLYQGEVPVRVGLIGGPDHFALEDLRRTMANSNMSIEQFAERTGTGRAAPLLHDLYTEYLRLEEGGVFDSGFSTPRNGFWGTEDTAHVMTETLLNALWDDVSTEENAVHHGDRVGQWATRGDAVRELEAHGRVVPTAFYKRLELANTITKSEARVEDVNAIFGDGRSVARKPYDQLLELTGGLRGKNEPEPSFVARYVENPSAALADLSADARTYIEEDVRPLFATKSVSHERLLPIEDEAHIVAAILRGDLMGARDAFDVAESRVPFRFAAETLDAANSSSGTLKQLHTDALISKRRGPTRLGFKELIEVAARRFRPLDKQAADFKTFDLHEADELIDLDYPLDALRRRAEGGEPLAIYAETLLANGPARKPGFTRREQTRVYEEVLRAVAMANPEHFDRALAMSTEVLAQAIPEPLLDALRTLSREFRADVP